MKIAENLNEKKINLDLIPPNAYIVVKNFKINNDGMTFNIESIGRNNLK